MEIKRVKHAIRFGDTSAGRYENLYRFQIDTYPNYDLLRMYENKGRKGVEKRTKTYYDNEGYSWKMSLSTGELLRRKTRSEIQRCLDVSLQRTNKVVREILMANHWEWFVTLTFNNISQNRADDKEVCKQWAKFRKDIRKRFPDMYYLAVPERHEDGCIHFHLPVGGVSAEQLKLVFSGHYDKNGREIYNCNAWRYGISTVTKVDDTEKVSEYILKYIGKDFGVSDEFKKRYWASKNCKRPKKRFVDFVTDFKVNVRSLFYSIVEPILTITTQFYSKVKNYFVAKDYMPDMRKIDFWFDNFNLQAHDGFWKVPRRT